MKTPKTKGTTTSVSTAGTLAAVLLIALPVAPRALEAQGSVKPGTAAPVKGAPTEYLKIKLSDIVITDGIVNGEPVYRNSRGERFTLDGRTGDQKFITNDFYLKFGRSLPKGNISGNFAGTDGHGHALLVDAKGVKFYIDPRTGDKVFVK